MKAKAMKTIALTLITSMLLPAGAALARPHHGGWGPPPPHHHRSHDGYHRDRVAGALIIGGILGAVITAQAKDREHDGVNDKQPCETCGKR